MEKKNDNQPDTKAKDEYLEEFGQRFKEIRQLLGLFQKDLAAGLDVSGSFLSEIENGKVNPGFDFLKKIYNNYNVNLHYLLAGHGEPFTPSSALSDPEKEKLHELLYYIENAPVVRYAVYEFFSNYQYKNRGMIEEDMLKHRKYLQKKK